MGSDACLAPTAQAGGWTRARLSPGVFSAAELGQACCLPSLAGVTSAAPGLAAVVGGRQTAVRYWLHSVCAGAVLGAACKGYAVYRRVLYCQNRQQTYVGR